MTQEPDPSPYIYIGGIYRNKTTKRLHMVYTRVQVMNADGVYVSGIVYTDPDGSELYVCTKEFFLANFEKLT